MSPNSRERERAYARRRYEDWQKKQTVRLANQRRQRRQAIVAGVAVLAVLVVAGVAYLTVLGRKDSATTAAATPSATPSATPGASASASPSSSAGPNPCPTPTVKPGTPQKFASAPDASLAESKKWTFTISTTCGDVVAELDGAKAPKAVASTIFLSQKNFWDGSPCHRLGVDGLFMLQCGDPTGTGTGGPGYEYGPVENAPTDKVYKKGVLAMARTQDPNSMGSQFFLVYDDTQLDGGYTVFGTITKGLDIVQKIAEGGLAPGVTGSGAPARPISIVKTSVAPA